MSQPLMTVTHLELEHASKPQGCSKDAAVLQAVEAFFDPEVVVENVCPSALARSFGTGTPFSTRSSGGAVGLFFEVLMWAWPSTTEL